MVGGAEVGKSGGGLLVCPFCSCMDLSDYLSPSCCSPHNEKACYQTQHSLNHLVVGRRLLG